MGRGISTCRGLQAKCTRVPGLEEAEGPKGAKPARRAWGLEISNGIRGLAGQHPESKPEFRN